MLEISDNIPVPSSGNNKRNTSGSTDNPLSAPGKCTQLSKEIIKDIDAWSCDTYDDGHRNHLGASLIGHDCNRYLWYVFNWCLAGTFGGRMQRLFQRGHREEAEFIKYLRGIGFEVWDLEPEYLIHEPMENTYFYRKEPLKQADKDYGGLLDVTGDEDHIAKATEQGVHPTPKPERQMRVLGVNGHFGGSLDGIAIPPERYGIGNQELLCEFKTKGTGKGFNDLVKEGLKIKAPQHYDQMCMYGWKRGIQYGLYMVVNKNDDTIQPEIVSLDWNRGEQLEQKASQIIGARVPPDKFASSSTHSKCKYCDFKALCHEGKDPERNCRSCKMSMPVENGQWGCTKINKVIPKEHIGKAQPCWVNPLA